MQLSARPHLAHPTVTSPTRRDDNRNTQGHVSSERAHRPNRTRTQPHTATAERRHSYAVACLAKMQADGVDVYAALPLLATYMGHADIVSAEYYLRLDPSAWADIDQAMKDTYTGVFPQEAV